MRKLFFVSTYQIINLATIFRLLALSSLLIAIISGCATVPQPEYFVPPLEQQRAGAPKLKYLFDLVNEKNLYPKKGLPLWTRVKRFLLGQETARFLFGRAGNVSADQTRVYVSDQEMRRIVVFDFAERKVYFWSIAGIPAGLAVDNEGRVYVANGSSTVILVYDRDGRILYTIGSGGHGDDRLSGPQDIAINKERGFLYVLDRGYAKILVFDLQGNYLFTFGQGEFLWAQFMAIDKQGKIYVTDSMIRCVKIFSPEGKFLKSIGEPGDTPGYFSRPKGVAVDSEGNIYVADSDFSLIQIFDPEGRVNFFWHGVPPTPFKLPEGLYFDEQDRLFVTDTLNKRIQVYQYIKPTP